MKAVGVISGRYIKVRIVQFVAAELILLCGLWLIFGKIDGTIFWPLSVGLALPTLFTEPYFTGPRTALATAIAQVASYFSSDHSTETALWRLLIISSAVVAVCAILAMLRQQHSGQIFHWVATRLGRAAVLGSIVSVILVLQVAEQEPSNATATAVLILIVYAVIFLDWAKLTLNPSKTRKESAYITALFAPNQLLISTYTILEIGKRVTIEGGKGSCGGFVAEELAAESGSRYRIVLDKHWRNVTDTADMPCIVKSLKDKSSKALGFAIEGSTEATIRMNPTSELKIGQTLEMSDHEGKLLYQVSGLRLEEEIWSNSSALVPRAKLVQVGALNDEGRIVVRPTLPGPYQKIISASDSTSTLSDDFMRIGVMKGTSIPVGIRKDWMANHGHLAVLGMSGMGKTTTAAKLAQLAQPEDAFVILDETSEYRTRLNFEPILPSALDWDVGGVSVCEPGGELPEECKKIVEAAMQAAQAEYSNGQTPRRRYILLEEAHGWLPEWNFTVPAQTTQVNKTCRYILQARKFNISFIMVSQRTAVISKSAISQCENYIMLRTLDQTSLEYVEGVVGSELKKVIPELSRYEAICVGPLFNSDSPIIVTLDPALTV